MYLFFAMLTKIKHKIPQWRQYSLIIIVSIIFLLIILRLILLQIVSTDCFLINQKSCKENLYSYADKKHIGYRSIDAHRGIIYDRNKEILAMSIPKKTLCINISRIFDPYIKNQMNFNDLLKKINMSKKEFNEIIRKNKK